MKLKRRKRMTYVEYKQFQKFEWKLKSAGRLSLLLVFVLTLSAAALLGCSLPSAQGGLGGSGGSAQNYNIVSDTAFKMDTSVSIKLYGWEDETTIDRAFDEIDRLEALLNVDAEGSDTEKLYINAGKQYTEVSAETLDILNKSIEYSQLTDGLFDVSAGPLISLWNIKDGSGHVPSDSELAEVLPLIDYSKILIDGSSVMLAEEGMKVNFGAIAKGYIADKLKELLVSEGVEHAIISLGGNVIVIGGKPDGSSFKIGIQDPAKDTGETIATLQATDTSLVSSGNYERYFFEGGKRYHHILDPKTGYPSETELSGVTIVTAKSVDADALSTSVFLLGLEEGRTLVESLDGVEAVFVTADAGVSVTSGLEGKLEQ